MAKFDVDVGGVTYEVDAPDERTAWKWANATHSKGATAPQPSAPTKPAEPADSAVVANAANKAIAGLPDMVLNAPNQAMNLGKAAFGAGAAFLGRPDLAPAMTPDPNYAGRLMRKVGMTSDAAEPTTGRQRVIDTMVQGAVGTAVAPANSVRGLVTNAVTGTAGGAAAGSTKEATGSDTAAIAAGMLTPTAVQAAGNYGRGKIADAELRRSQNEVRDKTLKDARAEGYVVSPSSVNPSATNKILESIAGKAATGQEAAVRNQAITNEVAARELGFPKGTALTEGKLETYRTNVAGPYREVAAMSQRAELALEQLKDARFNANAYSRHYDISADPNSLASAKALSLKADQLETQLEQFATQAGKPALIDALRDARTKIAKSYDIERSLNVGDAGVSAPSLGRAMDKGKQLSGGLKTTGRFAEAFPSVVREGAKVPSPGVSKVAAALAPILGIGGYGAMGPAGLVAGALPLASGPVRSMILSKPYQNLMANPDYSVGKGARALSELQQLTPQQRAVQEALLGLSVSGSNN